MTPYNLSAGGKHQEAGSGPPGAGGETGGFELRYKEAVTEPGQAQRMLIVDDDESLLSVVSLAFQRTGRDVVSCSTFEEARQRLREGHFDVLLTDVRLGAFNGIQLVVIARAIHPEMQIIVFSGFDDPVLRQEAEHLGAAYVVKPVATASLLKILHWD